MKIPVSLMPFLGVALAASLQTCFSQNETKPAAAPETKAVPAAQSPAASTPVEGAKPDKKPLPPNLKLSAWASEIVKLAQAGIDESVMLSFIENSGTFNLGADQIVYLSDLGVPVSVVNSMLQHDREVIAGVRVLTISSDPGYAAVHEPEVAQAPSPQPKVETASTTPTSPSPAPVETPSAPIAPASPTTSSFPNVTQITPPIQASAPTFTRTENFPLVQPATFTPTPAVKKPLYPTRSPYAEELLPPIIMVKAYTPPANVIIIERFPDAKP